MSTVSENLLEIKFSDVICDCTTQNLESSISHISQIIGKWWSCLASLQEYLESETLHCLSPGGDTSNQSHALTLNGWMCVTSDHLLFPAGQCYFTQPFPLATLLYFRVPSPFAPFCPFHEWCDQPSHLCQRWDLIIKYNITRRTETEMTS